MAATPTLAERLVEAEAAYHDLQTGKAVRAFTDQNGERVEYTAANSSKLLAYINDLKQQIAPVAQITGPMRVYFR